jgi:predicted nucleic acid-binding protein
MLTLVDTSVWINHLRKSDKLLIEKLESDSVLIHPAIIGELAAGNLKNRFQFLENIKSIPRIQEIPVEEIFDFIEVRRLFGKGLSWVDIQILVSCLINHCELFTYDIQLKNTFTSLRK